MKKIAIVIILFCTLYSAYSLDYRQVIFGNNYQNIIEIDADAFFEQYPAVKEYTATGEFARTVDLEQTTYARVYEQIIGKSTFYRVLLSYKKLTEADFLDWKNLYFRQVLFFKKLNTHLFKLDSDSLFGARDYYDNPEYSLFEIIERNNQVLGVMQYTLSESDNSNKAWYISWQNLLKAEKYRNSEPTISYVYFDSSLTEGQIIIKASNSLVDSKRPFMYTIQNAFDGNPATSYVENTEDDMFYLGITQSHWESPEPLKCTSYKIINGYASGDYYYQNNQIAKVTVGTFDYGDMYVFVPYGSFQLHDTVKPQVMNFEAMEIRPSSTGIRMEVDDITNGTKYNDTAIAEFDMYFEGKGWLFGSSDNDTIVASPAIVNKYKYTIKDGNAEIADYNGEGTLATEVTIPSIIEYRGKTSYAYT